MSWEDVARFLVILYGFGGVVLMLGLGIKWIEKRWLK